MNLKLTPLYLLVVSILCLGLVSTSTVYAASPSDILINLSPKNPAPFENTTISLSSYAYNLDTVLITWSVDGEQVLSEIGKKSFSVTVGDSGSTTSVVAKMDFPDGATQVRVVLAPAEMVLIYEATDSYTPPFYRGKALPTSDSEIKVVAIPEIKSGSTLVSPKNIAYSWRKDYNNEQGASGYGKDFFLYINDYLENSNTIGVTALSTDGKSSSEATITIGTSAPEISFYRKDPVFGIIWEDTLEDGHIIQGDEIIVAMPYYISPEIIESPSLNFNWSINGNLVETPIYDKNIFPVKVEGGITGSSRIGLQIDNQYKISQTANGELNVEF